MNRIEPTIEKLSAEDILKKISSLGLKITFSTSLGIEDQVITDMIARNRLPISVFTLDTGRLFPETYSLLEATRKKYGIGIKTYFPETERLQELISSKGPLSFYRSVEDRKECCYIRKVEPLKRALKGYDIWITGIRAGQSENRTAILPSEWDDQNKITKIHPLHSWTEEDLEHYVKEHQVPYNSLHNRGFLSIGCQPCTRAVQPGEDLRAGRWWWEDGLKKECGLHFSK